MATPGWISVLSTDGRHETGYSIGSLHDTGGEFAWTGLYLLYAEGPSSTDLEQYWANRISRHTDWELLRYVISIAYGMAPFAYLNNEGSETVVCDGAKYWLDRVKEPLAIPGDFPCGIYVFSSANGKSAFVLVVRGEHCGE